MARKETTGSASTRGFDDIIGVVGYPFTTKTGEPTIHSREVTLLTKSLHPLPDKHSGFTDIESRYRRRYADLIVNHEVRETFLRRSKIVQLIRVQHHHLQMTRRIRPIGLGNDFLKLVVFVDLGADLIGGLRAGR